MESKLKSNIIISIFKLQVTMLSKQEKILKLTGLRSRTLKGRVSYAKGHEDKFDNTRIS